MKKTLALVVIGFALAAWAFFALKQVDAPHNSFSEDSKYPEIVYQKDSGCADEKGVLPKTTLDADFDGDGKGDRIRLAQKDLSTQVLVAWLSSQEKNPREIETISSGRMSISLAKAGETIQSACARGYEEFCQDDQPLQITLKTNAVWYVQCESAASVLYWDNAKSSFETMPYSD